MQNNNSFRFKFYFIYKKIYSKTEMFKNRNIKKVIQMTPMTKNGNLISFDKRLLKSTKQFRMQFVTLLCYYIIMLLHC